MKKVETGTSDRSSASIPASSVSSSLSPVPRVPSPSLRWRCRRGMRELDVLLERYLERRYPHASPEEQRAFESLLELQDPQLFALVMRREGPADPELAHVIARLTDTGT